MSGTRAKALLRRQRAERFELELVADWNAQPFQKWAACFDCGSWAYCKGRAALVVRCSPCHATTRPARSRARRRSA